MKRKFLIFAIYQTDDGEISAFDSILERDDFPTKDEATKYMQSLLFSKIKGITGITEITSDCLINDMMWK